MQKLWFILFCGVTSLILSDAELPVNVRFESLRLIPRDASPSDHFGQAVAFSEQYIAVGRHYHDIKGLSDVGSVTMYTYDGQGWGSGSTIVPHDAAASIYFGESLAVRSNRVIIGAYGDDSKGTDCGAAYIYTYDGQRWILEEKLLPNDGVSSDYFSYRAVDIDGDYAVVGSVYADPKATNSGAAYVFKYNGSQWIQKHKLAPTDGTASSYFGSSIALDGKFLAVGAYGEHTEDYGAVYVFELDRDTWHQQIKLQAPTLVSNAYFGWDVAFRDRSLVIGAYNEHSGKGAVYVYTMRNRYWVIEKRLIATDGKASDQFGYSVSISKGIIVIGARGTDDVASDSGSAYVFQKVHGQWEQIVKLRASNAASSDYLGHSVSISNNKVILGAYLTDIIGTNSGSAYLYDIDVVSISTQKENEKLLPGSISPGDLYGNSIDISGDYSIVGSPNDDVLHRENSGSVYIYTYNGFQWSNGVQIAPNDGKPHDHFGFSVSIDATLAIVGCPDSKSMGVRSGSAYIYRYNGKTWEQEVKLVADDSSSGDKFGFAVDVHQNYAIVSSVHGGDSGSNSGAVYVFVYNGSRWKKASKLVPEDGVRDDLFGYSIAMNSDFVVVGSYLHDFNDVKDSGAIYIYKRRDDKWTFLEKKGDQAPTISGWFGHSIDVDANRFILGCHTKNNYKGSAFIFQRQGDTWIVEQEIFASDARVSDWFGYSVSIHGDNAVVSSRFADGKGFKSGSAYVFKNINGNWNEVMKLVASDGNKWDQFGNSVAISYGKVVVGSPYNDMKAGDGGSAYVFNIYFHKSIAKYKYSYFASVYNNRPFNILN